MRDYSFELEYFNNYNMSEERKIRLIESFYRLGNILFTNFIENN